VSSGGRARPGGDLATVTGVQAAGSGAAAATPGGRGYIAQARPRAGYTVALTRIFQAHGLTSPRLSVHYSLAE
jgi:hypothetical protein